VPRPRPSDDLRPETSDLGPVPEANRPGHHPDVEQDKPTGPPPRPRGSIPRTTRWDFRFDRTMTLPALLVGVTPGSTGVEIGEDDLTIRFGRWSLHTPLANVAETAVTGPYSWIKVAGPPHLSRSDSGITFATSTAGGACIHFHDRVPAALPVGLLRHEAATVTVADPEGFVAELDAAVRRARR